MISLRVAPTFFESSIIGEMPNVKDIFNRLSGVQARGYRVSGNAEFFGPLGNHQCLAVVGEVMIAPRVSHLLSLGGPSAIFRGIRTASINAVYAVLSAWARSHVCQKVLERVTPTVANGNAAPAIVLVSGMIWIIAAVFHASPKVVVGMSAKAVLRVGSNALLLAVAPATVSVFTAQVMPSHNRIFAAIATAQPIDGALVCDVTRGRRFFDNCQPAIAIASFIFEVARAFRGMIEAHGDLHSRCVKPWDVSASPGHFVLLKYTI
jgi:hypothetical protein